MGYLQYEVNVLVYQPNFVNFYSSTNVRAVPGGGPARVELALVHVRQLAHGPLVL